MNLNQILSAVVNIHNQAIEVNVHGDDVIRMAQIIQECRSLVYQLRETQNEAQVDTEEAPN